MKCDISLIVPNRNHAHKLPRLLDSVLAQQGARVEVVIVDDDSDEPYGELLDGYRSQGLRINFVQGEKRLYTKNARLAGIRAAQAPIVAFADADLATDTTDIDACFRRVEAGPHDVVFATRSHPDSTITVV